MCDPISHQDAPRKQCSGKCTSSCQTARAHAHPEPALVSATIATTTAHSDTAPTGDSDEKGEPARRRQLPSLDSVTTFGSTGQHQILHPAHADGPFYKARLLVGLVLISVFLALPWIPIGGAPAIFFDLAAQRFHLFGLTFVTQDLWLAFFLISGVGFGLFAITALLGRVWCGWACPLTVFLDTVRRVERWLEGDAPTRKRLDSEPWTFGKTIRRGLKHVAMLGLAAVLAHGFLAYFVSLPALFRMMHEAPGSHWSSFLLVFGLTGVLWFNFAWFREQFCIVLCPYGRLQSVLTDEHSLVIGYDTQRGEPRGSLKSGAIGDCVDCLKCVQVCPTGIDIRQGLQLECIGCAACVDACNSVMTKLKRPAGLIRYDSLAGLRRAPKRIWRPRIALYLVLMAAGTGAASLGLSTLRSASVSLIRMTGAPYFVQNGELRNQFLLRVLNKRADTAEFHIAVEGAVPEGLVLQGSLTEEIPRWGEALTPIVVTVPLKNWKTGTPLSLTVRDHTGSLIATKPLNILAPETL